MHMREMRNHARYRVRAPVFFSWKDVAAGNQRGEGMTRDIGTGGMFVWTDVNPPLGASLRVEVLLPRIDQEAKPLCIEASGHVIRAESRHGTDGGPGFGFSGDALVLVDLERELQLEEDEGDVSGPGKRLE